MIIGNVSGWASAPRCCREDTSLDVYQYITTRCGTANTMLSRCWHCPRTYYVEVDAKELQAEELPEKVARAKNRREQLAKLPHNRKKMRY